MRLGELEYPRGVASAVLRPRSRRTEPKMMNMNPSCTLLGWMLRHGELNVENIWDGWGNYDLSAEGVESAEKAAQWLSFERIGRVVASDVPRTLHTATIIMERCNVACPFLATDPNLRPLMVAGFTGEKKTPELLKAFEYYLTHRSEEHT